MLLWAVAIAGSAAAALDLEGVEQAVRGQKRLSSAAAEALLIPLRVARVQLEQIADLLAEGEWTESVPVAKWAQSDSKVYILVRYAPKSAAPPCLHVGGITLTVENQLLDFSAECRHSGQKVRYRLKVRLAQPIAAHALGPAEPGKALIVLTKLGAGAWDHLTNNEALRVWVKVWWNAEKDILDLGVGKSDPDARDGPRETPREDMPPLSDLGVNL